MNKTALRASRTRLASRSISRALMLTSPFSPCGATSAIIAVMNPVILSVLAAALLGTITVRAEDQTPPRKENPTEKSAPAEGSGKEDIKFGKYELILDTSDTPDLKEWADTQIVPMVKEWYPKIAEMLPSPGYEAPERVSIQFSSTMRGVAATGGNRIRCAAQWFRNNLNGEAKGAVLHELVHVVQNYGRGRRNNPNATRNPGWLVEGIADYIRWFRYEPQSKGAQITARNFSRARYDGNYRITANFLDYVETQHPGTVQKLNAAAREGKYTPGLWKECTGKTLEELDADWRKASQERLGIKPEPKDSSALGK